MNSIYWYEKEKAKRELNSKQFSLNQLEYRLKNEKLDDRTRRQLEYRKDNLKREIDKLKRKMW